MHLPLLDRLFGTQHLPSDQWPDDYGLQGDPVPEGYAASSSTRSRDKTMAAR